MLLTQEEQTLLAPVNARFTREGARVECGPGWIPILLECDAGLAAIDSEYTLMQVKEKFGMLRYYFHSEIEGNYPAMREIVRLAELASAISCEKCGAPGTGQFSRTGHMQTLCNEHFNLDARTQ